MACNLQFASTMTTLTAYAPDRSARDARLQMLRMRRRAARTEGLVRALVVAGALALLVTSLNGTLKDGAKQVASALDPKAASASVR